MPHTGTAESFRVFVRNWWTASGKVSANRQQSVLFGAYADVRDAAYNSALALASK